MGSCIENDDTNTPSGNMTHFQCNRLKQEVFKNQFFHHFEDTFFTSICLFGKKIVGLLAPSVQKYMKTSRHDVEIYEFFLYL